MIRITRKAAIGMFAVLAYTLVAISTTRWHESMFPGTHCNAPGNCVYGSEALGVAWPIGLPITAAFALLGPADPRSTP